MHVLITTDTLSSVWTYTRELVSGLIGRGARVTLVSFGEIPVPQQTAWMDKLHGLEYRPTAFRLDWMQDAEHDFEDSSAYLAALAKELKPNLLHLNHPSYGNLDVDTPKIVVAHGDLINWWKAVHGHEPKETQWLRWYRQRLNEGLHEADMVVAPTVCMLDSIRSSYVFSRHLSYASSASGQTRVIYHGRSPVAFNPYGKKENSILAVGRLLDPSTQLGLLTQYNHALPISIVGSSAVTPMPRLPIRADVKLAVDGNAVSMKGPQNETQMRDLYSRSSVYVATARYEPFGMTAVEAAFSRCVIVANDIPSHREVWGDAALYFRTNDAASLANTLERLIEDRELCKNYAGRAFQRAHSCFTANRMIDEYVSLYGRVVRSETRSVAA